MNPGNLRAILWLRWRILVNRFKRTGKLGNALFGVLLVLVLGACAGFFFLALLLGIKFLPQTEPKTLMLTWGALALGFLFAWMVGLVTDLQRSDAMSFKNLLHLPGSLHWIFLYNYLSSFVAISIALFLPAMLGLALAMVIVDGPLMLLAFPLVLGYFGMITALTYQLRGWLARLMEDKRRGRNILTAITVGFILLLQLPNLINMTVHSSRSERRQERAELEELREAARTEGPEQAAATAALEHRREEEDRFELELDRKLSLGAEIVPIGWLPYGMRAAFEGRPLPGLLCTLGLLAISGFSLRRSYRKTMASVVGAGNGAASAVPVVAGPQLGEGVNPAANVQHKLLLVQRKLPVVGNATAGIAFAGLRSFLRAPEAKLLLLSPVILIALFGVMLAKNEHRESLIRFAPMLSLGASAMGLLSIIQVLQNQFGLDRAGFRAYVLSPVPRHQILLGKNLAAAPLGIGAGLVALFVLQLFVPSDPWHILGACFQLVSGYLLLCMVGNVISILGPMRLRENGMKAANANFKTFLLQTLSVVLVPAALSPLLIPAGLEFLLSSLGFSRALPLYPLLHAFGLIGIICSYRWVLRREGDFLHTREQRALELLTRE